MVQPVMRRELLRADIAGGLSVAQVQIQEITMDAGSAAPVHLHPCPTVGVVLEGKIAFEIEGEKTRTLAAGEAFYEPANVRVARFDNAGEAPAKFVALYLLGENETETIRILEGGG